MDGHGLDGPAHKSSTMHHDSEWILDFSWADHDRGCARLEVMEPPRTFETPSSGDRCPCGSGHVHGECCGPLLAGGSAPTAVQLMRSRYTAFVVGDVAHLLATWHPSTRPHALELEPRVRWRSLEIVRTERGGPLDRAGIVEFAARYTAGAERGVQRETSRFVRGDRWLYVGAVG